MDVDILTKIIRWAESTTYKTKCGSKQVIDFSRGYEQGIADAKAKVLDIVYSEQ